MNAQTEKEKGAIVSGSQNTQQGGDNTAKHVNSDCTASVPESKPVDAVIHPFGIDPLLPSRKFMLEDLAKSGLVPSDFPLPPEPVPLFKDQPAYRLYYSPEYYKLRIDRAENKYIGVKGEVPPVVFFGEFKGAQLVATVEGFKKAVSFYRTTGIPTITIDSCWSFGESLLAGEDSDISRVLKNEIIHKLEPNQRHLVLMDGDWATNENVKLALGTYAMLLEELGASVQCLDLGTNNDGEKQGYDDLFVSLYGSNPNDRPTHDEATRVVGSIPRVPETELGPCLADALASDERFSNSLLDHTERGIGSLLIKYYGKANIKFNADTEQWLMWENNRWTRYHKETYSLIDPAGRFLNRRCIALVATMNKLQKRLDLLKDTDTKYTDLLNRKNKLKSEVAFLNSWITKLSATAGRMSILRDISRRPNVLVYENMFDANPYVLACQNGVIDLATGKLREEKQEDYITQRCPIAFPEKEPESPEISKIKQMLLEVTGAWDPTTKTISHKPERLAYLQKRIGASLIGLNSLTALELWHGNGANGKTVLAKCIAQALGDVDDNGYSAWSDANTIMTSSRPRDGESATPMIMRLLKARMVFMAESKDTDHVNEALVKQITGGDKYTGRSLFQEGRSVQPRFSPFLFTNNLPQLTDVGPAMLDRLAITNFSVRWQRPNRQVIKVEEKDFPIGDSWFVDKAHLNTDVQSYMLWWMVDGCVQWTANGLGQAPADVSSSVEKYVEANDRYTAWMENYNICLDSDPKAKWKGPEAYRSFENYMTMMGQKAPSAGIFYGRLIERFPSISKKRSNGADHLYGIRLLTATEITDKAKEPESAESASNSDKGTEGGENTAT